MLRYPTISVWKDKQGKLFAFHDSLHSEKTRRLRKNASWKNYGNMVAVPGALTGFGCGYFIGTEIKQS